MDVKEPKELIEEKLRKKYNLTFPIMLDTDWKAAAAFAPKDVLPDLFRDEVMLASNILIDPEGKCWFREHYIEIKGKTITTASLVKPYLAKFENFDWWCSKWDQ